MVAVTNDSGGVTITVMTKAEMPRASMKNGPAGRVTASFHSTMNVCLAVLAANRRVCVLLYLLMPRSSVTSTDGNDCRTFLRL